MVEVDEAQWNSTQTVVKTVAQIMQDPNRRRKLLELQKEADPKAIIPELDSRKPVDEAIEAMNKNFADLRKEMSDDREKRDNERRLSEFTEKFEKGRSLLKSRGYDAEGVAAVEKLMDERGILNHEDAMLVWEKMHPTPEPVGSSGFGSLSFLEGAKKQGEDDMSKLLSSRGESDLILNSMINNAISETRAA